MEELEKEILVSKAKEFKNPFQRISGDLFIKLLSSCDTP